MFLKIFILSFLSVSAYALPAALREGNTRFLARSLGSACYTMDSVQRGLPCNPAAAAKEKKARFDGDIFLGSNVEYLKEAESLLSDHATPEAMASFLYRRETVEGELSIEASFQASTWGISFEPYRLVAVTTFTNPSLPMIDLVIAEEQSVKAQIASYVHENFYAGVQARYTHVKFLGQYFSIAEALSAQNEETFKTETQELIYLEPGLLFSWEEKLWQPQISAVLAQWGVSSRKTEEYPIQPEGLLGASIKPLLPLGLLELGVQFKINSETETARDALRIALAYHLGILQTVFSASENDHAAAFLLQLENCTTGLSYWTQGSDRGVFVQLGVTL